MRTAAIDIGSNSTRLLISDVQGGAVTELERESLVTRLGDGVDASGALSRAAMDRVLAVLDDYAGRISAAGCERVGGVATSAVREAGNGPAFAREMSDHLGAEVRVIDGSAEAQLTFSGAASDGMVEQAGESVVIDVGGGSTEFVLGRGSTAGFHVSTRLGSVRQSERHLAGDPPVEAELTALKDEARSVIEQAVPQAERERVERGIAVAGTPTVLAAIDQQLVVFDAQKVHGHRLTREACAAVLARLAALPLAERRKVTGLHPDRAPTIVAGAAILLTAMQCFDLPAVTVSEHDVLYGLTLQLAG